MRIAPLALLSVVVLSACKEKTAPLVPASIDLVSPAPTSATVGTVITTPPTFEVRTASGKAIKNVNVSIQATLGSGNLVGAPTATGATATAIGTWTLGTTAGQQSVQILSGLLTPLVITVQATPGPVAALTIEEGDDQRAAANSAIPFAMRVKVADQYGNGIPNTTVTWAVTLGGGNVAQPTTQTNASGIATAPTWTVGDSASGAQILQASVGALNVEFDAVIQAPPASITIETAPPSTIVAGTVLTPSPTFVVRDAEGNVLADIPVTVTVTAGAGSIDGAPTLSTAGPLSIGTWTVGGDLGAQSVTIAVSGIPSAVVTTTSESRYDLVVVYNGALPSPAVQQAFTDAVTRMKSVIVGQMSQVQFPPTFDASPCVAGLALDGELIGGLRIYATIEAIDGVSGVLGSAGPCYTRTSNSLTVVGRMRFDSADMDNLAGNGSLGSVILHEMMHVIGIGTLWTTLGLNTGSAPGSTPLFHGPLAQSACINDHDGMLECNSGVPREDCLNLSQSCGGGTINSHWKESVFRTELMTGFLNAGSNPFSKMTMQALRDMGYITTFHTAEAYVVPPPSLMALFEAPTIRMAEPSGPIAKVNAAGQITYRYPQPPDQE